MWVLVKVKRLSDIGVDEERRIFIDKVDIEPHPRTDEVVYIKGRGFDVQKVNWQNIGVYDCTDNDSPPVYDVGTTATLKIKKKRKLAKLDIGTA